MYYGASCVASYGVPTLEKQLGHNLGVHRGYFVAKTNSTNGLVRQVADDHAKGRMPSVSTKVPASWADMAAGRQDTWLRALLSRLNATGGPVFLTLHHEPENDTGGKGMAPQDWREMNEHAHALTRTVAPKVSIVPILMQYTFARGSGRKPADWVPATPILSTDCYNAWSPTNGLQWRSLEDKMQDVLPYANGRPIVLGEYGCRTDKKNPGRAADWMQEAFDFARTNNFVSMSYFNSWQHSRFGSWELDAERLAVMKRIISGAHSLTL